MIMFEAIEVQRAKGEEVRRYAEELRRISLWNLLGTKNVTVSEITERKKHRNK
jgi:hypothetical protein